MKATLLCEYCGNPASLQIAIQQYDKENVRALFTVQTQEWTISVPGVLIGWNIEQLLAELNALIDGGRDAARLISFDEEILISIRRLDALQPTVVLDGRLNQPLPFVETADGSVCSIRRGRTYSKDVPQGVNVVFGGLTTDLTKMAELATQFRTFLQHASLSTANPWTS